jgi:uncharacterized membrane protein
MIRLHFAGIKAALPNILLFYLSGDTVLDYIKVFLLSAAPIAELRGGIPLGILLGLSPVQTFLTAIVGNMIIVIPWLMVLCHMEAFLASHKLTRPFYNSMVRKAEKKRHTFVKYGKYALFLFVAIPLPTTGAYTACVASRIFRVPPKDTFWIIFAGVVTAGLLVMVKTILITDAISISIM